MYLLATSNILPSIRCCNAQIPVSPQCQRWSTRSHTDRSRTRQRHYATIHASQDSSIHDFIPWPAPKKASIPPTPYEIFAQGPREPYSKHRFYQLVKIYHPDRNTAPDDSLDTSNPCKCTRAVALERYRLVVAANAILSDPEKRQAYDRNGWGWSRGDSNDPSRSDPHLYKYTTYHRWRSNGTSTAYQWPTDQDPMYNATWEDWERWYEEQAARARGRPSSSSRWGTHFFTPGRAQRTVYANNYAFISLVCLITALAGAGQATRINDASKTRMERTQIVNEETSKLLMKARQDALDMSEGGESKEKRIRRFLSQKEIYDDGEFDARVLRSGDDGMCDSGAVKDRDVPKFWEKPPER